MQICQNLGEIQQIRRQTRKVSIRYLFRIEEDLFNFFVNSAKCPQTDVFVSFYISCV